MAAISLRPRWPDLGVDDGGVLGVEVGQRGGVLGVVGLHERHQRLGHRLGLGRGRGRGVPQSGLRRAGA